MLNRTALVAAALMGSFATLMPPAMVRAVPTVQANVSSKRKRALFGSGVFASQVSYGRKSAGISVAQGKRNAKKARNVRRHKAAMKR